MKTIEEGFIGTALAQESNPPQKQQGPGGPFGMFLPMILVFVIFYFLMIRPQAKQRKKHRSMIQALKKGDEVVTSAGIHGRVTAIADNVATVEIAENVRIKVDKLQVALVKNVSNPT